MGERYTSFSVGMDVCDECLYETILKERPDYKFEPWGKKPIWAEYRKKASLVMCMQHFGDFGDSEAICLKHIEEMKQDAD